MDEAFLYDESEEPIHPLKSDNKYVDYRDFDSFPVNVKQEALMRKQYIDTIYQYLDGERWTDAKVHKIINDVSVTLGLKKVSSKTLRRWKNSYENADKSLLALVPKHYSKGNKSSKIDCRTERFLDLAVEYYLSEERITIADAHEKYDYSITNFNDDNNESLKAMSYRAFYDRIQAIPLYERTLAREGNKKAKMQYRTVSGHMPVTRVMEEVEIDHTPLDIILLDDELDEPLGRPFLTLLMDRCSKCIVGLYITLKEPSYLSVRSAILNTLKQKDSIVGRFPKIKCEWPCHGKIGTLVVDNGAEFWSYSLEQACLELNIQIQYNAVGEPWGKPFIERTFGTIIKKFIGRFPGKTFSNILEKMDYNPVKDAVIHFSAFNELFHKWIVDIYHQESNKLYTHVPILSWQQAADLKRPITFTDDELSQADIVLGKSDKCSLRSAGIHLHSLRYDSDELSLYRREFTTLKSTEVLVKTNLNDISYVHVFLPKLNKYLKVPCIDPVGYTKGLSLHHHQIAKKMQKNFIESKVDKVALARSRAYVDQKVDEEIESMRRSSRKKGKKLTGMSAMGKYREVNNENVGTIVSKNKLDSKKDSNMHVESNDVEARENWLDDWDDVAQELGD